MSELLPCPFCGDTSLGLDVIDGDSGWQVWCDSFACHVRPIVDACATEEEAVAAWNTRAPVNPMRPVGCTRCGHAKGQHFIMGNACDACRCTAFLNEPARPTEPK